jgi:hypothetical protein
MCGYDINDAFRYGELGRDHGKAIPYCRGLCQRSEPEENIRWTVRRARYTQAVYLSARSAHQAACACSFMATLAGLSPVPIGFLTPSWLVSRMNNRVVRPQNPLS